MLPARRLAHGAIAALVLALAASSAGETLEPAKAREDAVDLVFLLQYVGGDYSGAVRDGRVVDEPEYREMVDFVATARERFARLRDAMPRDKAEAVEARLDVLQGLVRDRASAGVVRSEVETPIRLLVEAFGIAPAPKVPPPTDRAADLYRENCAVCHGENGRGDGRRAGDLDPPPTDFTDRERMDSTAPFVFYNAITLGVASTAMPSFAGALTEEERWGLAFRLWSFVAPPPDGDPPISVSLRDLATRTTSELVPDVRRQVEEAGRTMDDERARALVARLRARPLALGNAAEHLARVRQDLLRATELVTRGDLDGASEVVTTSYLNDFEPVEAELDRVDPHLRQAFESGLVDFRASLRRGDRDAAGTIAAKLLETATASDRALREPRDRHPPAILLLALFVLAVGGGIAAVAWSRRGVGNRQPEG